MSRRPSDLESPRESRRLGSGWISGASALVLSVIGLGAVLCLRYPDVLTVADARQYYNVGIVRIALHLVLIAAFALGATSLVLRERKVLGMSAMALVLASAALGGSRAQEAVNVESDVYLGLDWFLLNLILTGIIFIPLERIFRLRDQPIFRIEWREDLFYFFVSSLLVQGLTYLSMLPSATIMKHWQAASVREWVASQPLIVQFFEIMFLTDFVQYWVHRGFHRVSWLWHFHAVHHSAQSMDWVAGSRMQFFEIVALRGLTIVPMYVLGFAGPAMYAYIFFVYLFSTFVHSNLRWTFGPVSAWFVTPRFHHWHHGIEREAIDVNFAVHFPVLDRLFGTYYLPSDGRWPSGYGIKGPMPKGFVRQFLYPFIRR